MINYSVPNDSFISIKTDDPDFCMTTGFQLTPRASIEFSNNCPNDVAASITNWLQKGWIKPIAYMREYVYEHEKIMEALKN